MNIKERIQAFWHGDQPDEIPYTIYQNEWRHTASDPAWDAMYADGLGVTWHVPTYRTIRHEVEARDWEVDENGHHLRYQVLHTPEGDVSAYWQDDWQMKYFLETAADYRVMQFICEHTEILPDYDTYLHRAREFPPYVIPHPVIGRTPLQVILVDYAGLQGFSTQLVDCGDEIRRLYKAMLNNFRRIVEVVAGGPGYYISNLENFTAESLGPRRYREFLLPVYEECFPILHAAGKIVGSHYDGRTASCKNLIAGAPIDLIESLTPPPEGDLTLAEARAAWPDKLFWSNINVGVYDLPHNQIRDIVLERAAQAAPDGRLLAFQVSELYPENWKQSMPAVLKALHETRRST